MLVKTITYEDYNGEERAEDFYFNLSKAECLELETSVDGGISQYIRRIVSAQNGPEIMAFFKKLIMLSYGIKSLDGKYFEKSPEISKRFEQSPAYSELLMEIIAGGEKAAGDFVNAIMPKDMDKVAEDVNNSNQPQIAPVVDDK